jgi:hypothetical protein
MLVRMSSDLETNIVSVERVKEYAEVETEVITRRKPQTCRKSLTNFIT